jgi:hypothetical protein
MAEPDASPQQGSSGSESGSDGAELVISRDIPRADGSTSEAPLFRRVDSLHISVVQGEEGDLDDPLASQIASLRHEPFIIRAKAVAKYNVDLFWATLNCSVIAVCLLALIRVGIYRGDTTTYRMDKPPSEYWPLFIWDAIVIAIGVGLGVRSTSPLSRFCCHLTPTHSPS